jgi:hypothetical protein
MFPARLKEPDPISRSLDTPYGVRSTPNLDSTLPQDHRTPVPVQIGVNELTWSLSRANTSAGLKKKLKPAAGLKENRFCVRVRGATATGE